MADSTNPIVYAAIVKGRSILVDKSLGKVSMELIRTCIDRIPETDGRNTFQKDDALVHYIVAGDLKVLCQASAEFGHRIPFSFLDDIRRQFIRAYLTIGSDSSTIQAIPHHYQEFAPTVMDRMKAHGSKSEDKISKVQAQMDDVKNVMLDNVEKVITRGEKLDVLQDKAGLLKESATEFKKETVLLRRDMWLRNIKLAILILVLVTIAAAVLVIFFCGGITLPDCRMWTQFIKKKVSGILFTK